MDVAAYSYLYVSRRGLISVVRILSGINQTAIRESRPGCCSLQSHWRDVLRGWAVRNSFELTFRAVFCAAAVLLFFGNAAANIHDVETIRVIAAEEPPAYDLAQIEDEVTDAISRTNRNLWVRVALLEIDPLGFTLGDDCGSGDAVTAAVGLLCELGNSVEQAARRAAINEAIRESKQAHVDSDAELAPDLADGVDRLLSSNLLQLRLAAMVEDFVTDHTGIEVVGIGSTVVPRHRLATNLVRVEAISNRIDSRIAIRLHGEAVLVSNGDGAIVDSYSYVVETPSHLVEGWSQGGVGLLARSFSEAITKMAEVLGEEILLIVTSPRQRRTGYLVQPISPKYKVTLIGGSDFITGGGQYRATDTLQPTFGWEDFRDAYARDPLYEDVTASQLDVSYDLRIYRSRPARSAKPMLFVGQDEMPISLIANELVHEYRGISGEAFTPEVKFDHCTPYAWTIRARFVINGRTHLTYWSGGYKEKNVEKLRRLKISEKGSARMARSIGGVMGVDADEMWLEEAQYFPFLVTSPGKKCSKEEILAAMAEGSP